MKFFGYFAPPGQPPLSVPAVPRARSRPSRPSAQRTLLLQYFNRNIRSEGEEEARTLTKGRLLKLTRKLCDSNASVAVSEEQLCRALDPVSPQENIAILRGSPETPVAPPPRAALHPLCPPMSVDGAPEAHLGRGAPSDPSFASTPLVSGTPPAHHGSIESALDALSNDANCVATATLPSEAASNQRAAGTDHVTFDESDDSFDSTQEPPPMFKHLSQEDIRLYQEQHDVQLLASMYPNADARKAALRRLKDNPTLSGTADELLKRLSDARLALVRNPKAAVEAFSRFSIAGKPETIAFYGKTFNLVDRFDQKLAKIAGRHRTTNVEFAMLSYLVRVALAQCHSIWFDEECPKWMDGAGNGVTASAPEQRRPCCSQNVVAFQAAMVQSALMHERNMCGDSWGTVVNAARKRRFSGDCSPHKQQKNQ